MPEKVLIAVSGGVDSAVAAALLVQAGYDVTAVFLCLQSDSLGPQGRCASEPVPRDSSEGSGKARSGGSVKFQASSLKCQDAGHDRSLQTSNLRPSTPPDPDSDARQVAGRLGIRFQVLSVAADFSAIIDHFVEEYENGRTPNPCIRCNERVKFGRLFDLADSVGARYVATGHYARIAEYHGQPAIAVAGALEKDQSYALFRIPRPQLSRILFPVGDLPSKQAVRAIAGRLGLEVHDKADSQDICFVPDGDYVSLLEARGSRALGPGNIVDSAGQVVGKHDGYGRFTIGQRRGTRVAMGRPAYVTHIDPQNAVVTIGPREQLRANGLTACGANWQVDVPTSFEAVVKIRYNHRGAPARITRTGDDAFEVRFHEPLEAVTPGQAAVAYGDGFLLGGGWIQDAIKGP